MSAAPVTTEDHNQNEDKQKKQTRRTALLLGLIAAGMYFGFIIATGLKG